MVIWSTGSVQKARLVEPVTVDLRASKSRVDNAPAVVVSLH